MDQMNSSNPVNNAPATPVHSPSGSPERIAADAELMQEIADALGDMRLEDMVDDRSTAHRGAQVNGERQLRVGTVFRVHDGEVFIEFDAKRQGVCPVAQFEAEPKAGEKYEFFEERFDPFEGLWVVSRPGATHKGELNSLMSAADYEDFLAAEG